MNRLWLGAAVALVAGASSATWTYDSATKTATDGTMVIQLNAIKGLTDMMIGKNGNNGDAVTAVPQAAGHDSRDSRVKQRCGG